VASQQRSGSALTRDDLNQLGLNDDGEEVERVPWEEHFAYLEENWATADEHNRPNAQHCSIFAPTDSGKTHLIRRGLLPLFQRYPVLWVLYKPRDATIGGMGRKVRSFPTWDQRVRYSTRPVDSPKWESDPEWFVLMLPGFRWTASSKHENASWVRARKLAGEAIDRAFREGGWVLVIDEVRAFSDAEPPSLALSAVLENSWQRGRSQPLTIIAATQAPSKAPYSMYDQPRHVYLGRTLDVGRFQRISEIGGNTELIKQILPTLEAREFLYVDRRNNVMMIVTAPDR
jgi:hypothetical protein